MEHLKNDDEQGFIDELLDGQPDAHAYFARMKHQNQEGPALLGERVMPREISAEELMRGLEDGALALIDTRPVDQVHAGTVPGALHLPMLSKAAGHIAWAFDPDTDDAELVVLAEDAERAAEYGDHFVRVGVDSLFGYVPSLEGLPSTVPSVISPAELERQRREGTVPPLLDVRTRNEHAAGTIPGAQQLSAGKVLFHQAELPVPEAGPIHDLLPVRGAPTPSPPPPCAAPASTSPSWGAATAPGTAGEPITRRPRPPRGTSDMCRATTCRTCGKTTWAGCGQHNTNRRSPACPPASAAPVTPRSRPRRDSSHGLPGR